ncbi:T9SS type A sorting domain-containing protein [Lutimonas sp.]|uniref:T9SS type A sorting domain-containing protein n=1 Tax=Lutimonas sp. TaxID=1872403 RepID=UPI003D9BC2C6
MKKFLLVFFVCIYFNFSAYAQEVEIYGIGISGEANSDLIIPNIENVDKVEVGAFYISGNSTPMDNDVLFKASSENKSGIWNNDVIMKHDLGSNYTIGYFSQFFDKIDQNGLSISVKPVEKVHSFYSYIYRNDITSESKSYINFTPAFFYKNGENDPYVYNIPIHKSDNSRKIKIKIPVSELNDDERIIAIEINAGPVNFKTEVKKWNNGKSFYLGEFVLKNVPGNVTNVSVSIYSPDNKYGDSFFVSGVIVDVEKVGCTFTQGYWKNHSECKRNGNGPKRDDTWDHIGEGESPENSTIFFKSEQTYCDVFATQPSNKNGKYYILAHQYIATELNLYNNSDPTDIAHIFKEASRFLEKYTPEDIRNNKNLQEKAVKLGGTLDEYNNGKIGPGHCDDNDDDDDDDDESDTKVERTIIKETLHAKKIKIYPNPVVSQGQIEFKAASPGKTTVELFNISGQKVADLYNASHKKGAELIIEFNTMQLRKGLYFAIIKNGNDVFRHKIAVSD